MTDADSPGPVIRVFLLDDHELVRVGVRDFLETQPDIRVIGEAGTATSALARISALRPTKPCVKRTRSPYESWLFRTSVGRGAEDCRRWIVDAAELHVLEAGSAKADLAPTQKKTKLSKKRGRSK